LWHAIEGIWHALEVVWNLLEVILNWRMTLCILIALAGAALVSWLYPEVANPIFLPALIAGAVVGLAWELARMFTRRSSW
jgi:hypothetical protein